MNATRGRGSASSRIIASARAATAGHGVGMTATSIPSLNVRSQSSSRTITSGGVGRQVTTSRSNSVSSIPVTNPDNGQNATINSVYELCNGILSKMNGFDDRLKQMEDKQLKISDAIKELHDMIKKMSKASFAIKGTPYEVRLKV